MTESRSAWRSLLGRLQGRRPPPAADPPWPAPAADGSLLADEDLRALVPSALEKAVRIRCHTVPVEPSIILCRVLGRFKMLVDGRDIALSPHLMLDGYWEMWTTTFMLRHAAPGMVAIDVGANLGYFSVLLAHLVGPTGRVIAVEPNPRLAQLAERNLALNGFWHTARVERIAAGATSGQPVQFRFMASDPKNGHVVEAGAGLPPGEAMVEIAVPGMRLDDVVAGPVDLIKIDIEGAEEQAWAGMTRLLDASPAIIVLMEFNAFRCRTPDETLAGMQARFPLRELRLDGAVVPVEAEAILRRREDTLLVLTRRDL